jgi:heat-inducible transcriptional repressor
VPVLRTMVHQANRVFSFSDRDDYVVDGVRALAGQPEFYSVEELRKVLTLLEDKNMFLHLFARKEGGVEIKIGRENVGPLSSLSIVSAPYRYGNLCGAIGLIGPTRMNYSKAVSIVEYTARKIDELGEE